jgi:hypothetical protein
VTSTGITGMVKISKLDRKLKWWTYRPTYTQEIGYVTSLSITLKERKVAQSDNEKINFNGKML